jgi:hypothetical protein
MMPAGTAHPTTALALLFGGDDDAALQTIADCLLSGNAAGADPAADADIGSAVAKLPQAVREAAVRDVATAAAGLLNLNLADVLVAGWRKYEDLAAAARRTLAVPGSTELVDLAAHRVTMTAQPYVSMLVDGRRVATVRIELSLVFDVTAVVAGVSTGRLTALHSGRCDVTATLAIQGMDVATERARLQLPGVIALGTGIPLLRGEDAGPETQALRSAPSR